MTKEEYTKQSPVVSRFKVLRAVQYSIEHWIRMRDGTNSEDEYLGPEDCALCELFYWPKTSESLFCENCPIFLKTGQIKCHETPYSDAVRQLYNFGKDSIGWKVESNRMITFLTELLLFVLKTNAYSDEQFPSQSETQQNQQL